MAALFGEITQKGDGTSAAGGLKHVTDDLKTYKQVKEGEAQPVNFDKLYAAKAAAEERRKAKEAEAAAAAGAAPKAAVQGPPQFEQAGARFMVKNIVGGADEKQERKAIPELAINHAVVVQSCAYMVLQIGGKFNSLTVMGSSNVAVGMDTVVTTIDITNCRGVTVHVAGVCRSVVVDKSSEVNLIFANPETARTVQVVTSVCSTVNVRFPNKDDAEELLERPLPEQFVSRIVKDEKTGFFKLVTRPADN